MCVCARAPRVPGTFHSALFTRLPCLLVFTKAHSIQKIMGVSFLLTQSSLDGHLATTNNAAAAAAASNQSCTTLCDPIDSSPTRLPRPWDILYNTGKYSHYLVIAFNIV